MYLDRLALRLTATALTRKPLAAAGKKNKQMMRIYQIDSFTTETFKGNPAGVCLIDNKIESFKTTNNDIHKIKVPTMIKAI